jgi:hypothetical protein
MYVVDVHLQVIGRSSCLLSSLIFRSEFFEASGMSACQNTTGSESQCKECTSEFCGFRKRRARRVYHMKSLAQEGSLKVAEYPRGRTVQRKA